MAKGAEQCEQEGGPSPDHDRTQNAMNEGNVSDRGSAESAQALRGREKKQAKDPASEIRRND